jgi:hypothetical protein
MGTALAFLIVFGFLFWCFFSNKSMTAWRAFFLVFAGPPVILAFVSWLISGNVCGFCDDDDVPFEIIHNIH